MYPNQLVLDQQAHIINFLQVKPHFSPSEETQARINFLKKELTRTTLSTYVLGISGGIDSTVTGRLAQLAVEELRKEGYKAQFIAVRLPYGVQKDEEDAKAALQFINPDEIITVNIKKSSDELLSALQAANFSFLNEAQEDFTLGNIKARQRMIIQYAIAGVKRGLVIGTDHAAEALMGFFTKFGDGACDLTPLTGLNKRRIRAIAGFLGAPNLLITKCPTADLELLTPLKPDEEAYGITYEEIDDFLENKVVNERVYQIIFKAFNSTTHKRELPIAF